MKTRIMKASFLLLLSVVVLLMPSVVVAQSAAGKLAGKVLDSETKEPLIGANITIVGSSMGTSTDIDGEYFILNIPPAAYAVRIGYIGYQTQEIIDVRIVSGVTKQLDVFLKASTVELNAVTIQAEKVFFEAKATNTVKVVE
jgi:hypothetical protein